MNLSTNSAIPPHVAGELRKTALIAGIIYLVTYISIPTLSLYRLVHDPNYVIGQGPDSGIILGALLEIIVALSGIGTAVVLYPVLKRQSQAAALGLVGSRILEAATIFVGVAFLLAAVALRQNGFGPEAIVTSRTLAILYDRIFLIGQSFMPAINDLLIGLLFYHSRLIPRRLALIGIIGAPMLVSADVAVLFGWTAQFSFWTIIATIPVAVFEFALGLWLVIKGFNTKPLS